MKLFRVLWQCDAYIAEDWFASEYLANRWADQQDGKEKLVAEFLVHDSFCKDNGVSLSDADAYSSYEWELIHEYEDTHNVILE